MPEAEATPAPKFVHLTMTYPEFAAHATLYMLAISFRRMDLLGMTQAGLVLDNLGDEPYINCINQTKDVMKYMSEDGINPHTGEPNG